jgi:hypothetical protein
VHRHALACFVIIAGGAFGFACSALVGFDGFVGNSAADANALDGAPLDAANDGKTNDATLSDSSSAVDSSDKDSTPPGTVIFTDDFEDACTQAVGGYQASLTVSTIAHSGNFSCEVCYSSGSAPEYTLDNRPTSNVLSIGMELYGQAWVRAVSSTSVAQVSQLYLRTDKDDTDTPLDENGSVAVTLTTDWQLVEVTLTATTSGAVGWDYYVAASETNGTVNPGDCFLVDDLVITQLH